MPSPKPKSKPAPKPRPASGSKKGSASPKRPCGACERVEVTYKGRVQGVGFRFCAEKVALEIGVRGWVRNEHNGDVSMVAEGGREELLSLLEGIQNSPVGRHISKALVRWEPFRGEFDDFRIEYHV